MKPEVSKIIVRGHTVGMMGLREIFLRGKDLKNLGEIEAEKFILEEVEERKGELQPNYSRGVELKALDIYKLLPGTNCKACDELTCLAFAAKVLIGEKSIVRCPRFFSWIQG